MSQKTTITTGWILSVILAMLFSLSAFMKLTQNETAVAQAASLGINAGTYQWIGIVEAVSVILFLIPRTAIIGSLLLIAYMGGATATHLAHQQPIIVTIIIQILVWVTVALRFPQLTQQLFFPVQKKLGHN